MQWVLSPYLADVVTCPRAVFGPFRYSIPNFFPAVGVDR